jgi:hypothetical protein
MMLLFFFTIFIFDGDFCVTQMVKKSTWTKSNIDYLPCLSTLCSPPSNSNRFTRPEKVFFGTGRKRYIDHHFFLSFSLTECIFRQSWNVHIRESLSLQITKMCLLRILGIIIIREAHETKLTCLES